MENERVEEILVEETKVNKKGIIKKALLIGVGILGVAVLAVLATKKGSNSETEPSEVTESNYIYASTSDSSEEI